MSAGSIQPGPLYYRPPRYCDRLRTLRATMGAGVVLAVGSAIYVYALPRRFDVMVPIGLACCSAFGTGVVTAVAIRYGKVSSRILAAVLGLLLGLLALYFMWVFWVQKRLGRWDLSIDLFRLALHPLVVIDLIRRLHEVVSFDVMDHQIAGNELWLLWAAEGLGVVGCAVGFGILGVFPAKPVCTECGTDCPWSREALRFAADQQNDIIAAINQRDLASLSRFSAPADHRDPELTLRLATCPNCGRMIVLRLNWVGWATTRQGVRFLKTKTLIDGLIITPNESAAIQSLHGKPSSAQADSDQANAEPKTLANDDEQRPA